jgi:hypothetical protein
VHPSLPGSELVEKGLSDLADGRETVEALLVSIGAHRLRVLGFAIDSPFDERRCRPAASRARSRRRRPFRGRSRRSRRRRWRSSRCR